MLLVALMADLSTLCGAPMLLQQAHLHHAKNAGRCGKTTTSAHLRGSHIGAPEVSPQPGFGELGGVRGQDACRQGAAVVNAESAAKGHMHIHSGMATGEGACAEHSAARMSSPVEPPKLVQGVLEPPPQNAQTMFLVIQGITSPQWRAQTC